MKTMTICDTKGHKYYPAVRRISGLFAIPKDENILYCARCADIKSLDAYSTYYETWGSGTINTSSFTTGWTYLNLDGGSDTKV